MGNWGCCCWPSKNIMDWTREGELELSTAAEDMLMFMLSLRGWEMGLGRPMVDEEACWIGS